ncbi:TonB-dependent receptor [Asticcacaulis sp. SL142]|uniref:TonB-dependent receptor n=1 Tax=Asticcacaulis sp. SL142 TaxID=2995155 RepID=UPI00226C7E32|nr:TonB-dependent receptor [Asticcacaulis sp. SL142]WAC48431.1 TonB-dependent receptor [Asticcacaulis sp. SL142]
MKSRITHTFGARLRRSLNLSTAMVAVAVMSASGVAMAQEAAPAEAAADEVQEVVVVGTRASLQSAMNRKKRAGTVSDSIVAEDIGQFPDKNVGEALGRITGVQLARDMGEGNQVSIRGVEPDLNRVEINGVSLMSTAGNINVYGGGGRGNDFRELPSEMVKSIDVFKGFTADMTEGGVGGTVSVQTRRPLDFKKPTFSITASAQNLDTLDGWTPRASLFGATQLFDGKLGLMGSVSRDKVKTRGDYIDNHSWRRLADFDNSEEKTVDYYNSAYNDTINGALSGIGSEADCATAVTPDSGQISTTTFRSECLTQWHDYQAQNQRYRVWTRDDDRVSAEFTAQYRVSDNFDVWASYQHNTRRQQLNDINYGTSFTSLRRLDNVNTGGTCTGTNANNAGTVPGIVVDENHNVTLWTAGSCLTSANNGGNNAFSISSRDFSYKATSEYVSYGFNYNGDRWKIAFIGANAETETLSKSNNVSIGFDVPGMVVSLGADNAPTFTFAEGYSPSDISAARQFQIQYRPSQAGNTEDQYKLDFTHDTNWGPIESVQFGVRYSDAVNSGYGYGGYIVSQGNNLTSNTDDIVVYANSINSTAVITDSQLADQLNAAGTAPYTTTFWNSNETWSRAFASSVFQDAMTPLPSAFHYGGGAIASQWLYPDFNSVAQHLDTSHFNLDNLYTTVGSDGQPYNQIPYRIQEKTNAQYLRVNYAFPAFTYDVAGNFGLRRVTTEVTSSGQYTRRENRDVDVNLGTTTGYVVVGNTFTTMKSDYTVYLPSFNINAWIKPGELNVRAGWAKLMARPKLNFIQPNMTCDINLTSAAEEEPDTCNAGNPDLKPYRADQFDLSGEWYPNRDTQLSVGLFYKDIKSFYIDSRTSLGLQDVFNDGTLYYYNTYVNGEGAQIEGVELTAKTAFTFLPGIWSGFGVDANYTYQEAKNVELYSELDGSALPYPGLSSDSANLTLWYDKGPINARLAYNYRSEYLAALTVGSNTKNPVFAEATGYLDGKITWKPGPEGLSFFAEGKNLTGESERTTAGDIRLINEGYSGKRFFVGVTIKR